MRSTIDLKEMMANTSGWMNETWGPPIKDQDGNVIPVCEGPMSPRARPTSLKQLTPQYSNRKRRGITPPEDVPPHKKAKKSIKQHKKLTAPGNADIRAAHDGDNRIPSESENSSYEGKKKLVLVPPTRPEPGKTCARCDGVPTEFGYLLACPLCYRNAYCSVYCKSIRATSRKICSDICDQPLGSEVFGDDDSPLSSPPSLPDLYPDAETTSNSSDEDGRKPPPNDRSPESDAGKASELSDWDVWEMVDFRISKSGRQLIYEFENVETHVRKSLPARQMLKPLWKERLKMFWMIDNSVAWEKRTAMASSPGYNPYVKHDPSCFHIT